MADFRPEGMMYLILAQTQDVVTGSLMMVTPDAKGGTKSRTLSLQGVTDRSTITLRAKQLFEDITISGRKQDEQILLMFPNDSGIISTVTFVPALESEFNMVLKNWRQLLANTHEADQQIQRQKQQEEEKLRKLARMLYDDLNPCSHPLNNS
ncbi:hypothetical protein ABZN20_04715 [Methylococcus sp. ANG]|uniref:hypothetical protein n=1 Tax=Methylococcus sp. ANG TaxID=3231903 RepID=UPI00345921B5